MPDRIIVRAIDDNNVVEPLQVYCDPRRIQADTVYVVRLKPYIFSANGGTTFLSGGGQCNEDAEKMKDVYNSL